MSTRVAPIVSLALLFAGPASAPVFAQGQHESNGNAGATALAGRLDKIIHERLKSEKFKPGPPADHSQIARRLHIDLTGRIPTLLQMRDYLENDSPKKYSDRVDELIASSDFARNFTHYYRSIFLTGTANAQGQQFQGQFESWLYNHLAAKTPFDKIAHEIITSTSNPGGQGPGAFNAVNENKAEHLAGSTARIFLGVKIECAQCHKHPFAKWTWQQFWETAAFFSGMQPLIPQPKGQTPVSANNLEITIPDTNKIVKAKFLTGEVPGELGTATPRGLLADWVTSSKNPYFAKSAVDHLWQYFFGVSLTEPILEPLDDTTPTHSELLDELANSFIASGFDVRFLIKAIVLTDAYKRASVALNPETRESIYFFAKMPIRGMMPEQLYDSFAEAADFRQEIGYNETVRFPGALAETPRQQFLNKFASQDRRIEMQTSILQALYLMNGKLLGDHVKLENNEALRTIATAPTSNTRRVETLYLMVLSRLPRADETEKMVRYIDNGGGTGDPGQAVAEIYWALLNTSEFMLNH